MLLDEAGKIAWKAQLDLYGVARVDVMRTDCPWRWPGQYEDKETGLYYNRFRYYDPDVGRYISQDPIRLKGGSNPFSYTADPLVRVDPLGLSDCRKIYRGSDRILENQIFEETGHLMSDAAQIAYKESLGAGNSMKRAITDALRASMAAQ